MQPVTIGAPRRHWLGFALAAGALTPIGGLMIGVRLQPIVGWIILVACGAGTLFAGWQFYDARPRMVIDDRGVLDRTFAIGVIPWDDITNVTLKRVQGRTQLCLHLRNAATYTSRLPPTLLRMVALNRELGLTDLSIDLTGLASDPADLETMLRGQLKSRVG
jgi:hypothetical protein